MKDLKMQKSSLAILTLVISLAASGEKLYEDFLNAPNLSNGWTCDVRTGGLKLSDGGKTYSDSADSDEHALKIEKETNPKEGPVELGLVSPISPEEIKGWSFVMRIGGTGKSNGVAVYGRTLEEPEVWILLANGLTPEKQNSNTRFEGAVEKAQCIRQIRFVLTADAASWTTTGLDSLCVLTGDDPVAPGEPLGPFDTAASATNAMEWAVFTPSEEVLGVLTTSVARTRYAGWFGLGVTSKGASEWYVETVLTDEAKAHLAEIAAAATRQIPVAEIAALEKNAITNVTVTGCEPGFYYTFYAGRELAGLSTTGMRYWSELCGAKGTFEVPVVAKPSEEAGFFTIGVDAEKPDNAGIVVFGMDGKLFSGVQVDFGAEDGTEVWVWPENVKPVAWYGLGRSETSQGPFAVEEDAWVPADVNGLLHRALWAPKIGAQGFYKVIVR